MTSPPLWRKIFRTNFTRWQELADFLQLSAEQIVQKPNFPLNLPRRLAEKIEKGNPHDPILLQFLPTKQELLEVPGFSCNPVGDPQARTAPRLLHKYRGRCLLITTSACAMHCRYCFRQHFDYSTGSAAEIEAIRQDPSLHEVILSGGDPLSLSNQKLKELITHLDAIPHLTRLRFHTRFPIGIPERIDDELLEILAQTRLQTYFVIHSNHARELDDDVVKALSDVKRLYISLLNQAVLLRGVNDTEEAQLNLCTRLVDSGILPYYLHQLDRVDGAAHFEVPESRGLEIIEHLREHLPGYAVPEYVREIAGEPSKSPISAETSALSAPPSQRAKPADKLALIS